MKQLVDFLLTYQLHFALICGFVTFCVYAVVKNNSIIATGQAVAAFLGYLGVPNGLWVMYISTNGELNELCPTMSEHSDVLLAGGALLFFAGIAAFFSGLFAAFKKEG